MNIDPLLQEADLKAERVVAVIRLLIGAALLLAFVVSVGKTPQITTEFGADMVATLTQQWRLALAAIGSYFALGTLAFLLIRSGWYRPWMCWPFATLDVVIAVLSIWLSLRNTGLMGAYAPLLPSSGLILIVLATGTLRYRVGLQAYLGGLCVLGLIFITYMTGGFVGPGFFAERTDPARMFLSVPPTGMRFFMLAAAAAVLVLAVWRARAMLRRAVAAARRQGNLARYLPRQIADLLSEGDIGTLRTGRRAPVAVLFVDLREFTGMSEGMDAAELSAFMTRYRSIVTDAADQTDGVVDKFVGDGAMIVFGLDRERADDAASAIRCAMALGSALSRWSDERASTGKSSFRTAMGLHSGAGFCGVVGDEARLEFTVLGDVVNIASRLEAVAKSQNAMIAASAEALARAGLNPATGWVLKSAQSVRGRSAPMDIWLYHAMPGDNRLPVAEPEAG